MNVIVEEAMLENTEVDYKSNRHRLGCCCCVTCEVYTEVTGMDVGNEELYQTSFTVVAETESSSDGI